MSLLKVQGSSTLTQVCCGPIISDPVIVLDGGANTVIVTNVGEPFPLSAMGGNLSLSPVETSLYHQNGGALSSAELILTDTGISPGGNGVFQFLIDGIQVLELDNTSLDLSVNTLNFPAPGGIPAGVINNLAPTASGNQAISFAQAQALIAAADLGPIQQFTRNTNQVSPPSGTNLVLDQLSVPTSTITHIGAGIYDFGVAGGVNYTEGATMYKLDLTVYAEYAFISGLFATVTLQESINGGVFLQVAKNDATPNQAAIIPLPETASVGLPIVAQMEIVRQIPSGATISYRVQTMLTYTSPDVIGQINAIGTQMTIDQF